jgi:hypothetical protein
MRELRECPNACSSTLDLIGAGVGVVVLVGKATFSSRPGGGMEDHIGGEELNGQCPLVRVSSKV